MPDRCPEAGRRFVLLSVLLSGDPFSGSEQPYPSNVGGGRSSWPGVQRSGMTLGGGLLLLAAILGIAACDPYPPSSEPDKADVSLEVGRAGAAHIDLFVPTPSIGEISYVSATKSLASRSPKVSALELL
jgi:hypothetical protein